MDDLRREFEEYERLQSSEEARLLRQLTDQERFEEWVKWCGGMLRAFGPFDARTRRIVREIEDRDKDAALARMIEALG